MSKNKEPLIVDGINVSKCCYVIDYDPPEWQGTWGGAIHKGACRVYSKDCKYNPNCDFKQLARKTQECEALKKRNEDNERFYLKQYAKKDSEVLDLTHQLNVKTQECEELKEKNKVLQKLVSELEYSVQTGIELNARCCNALEEIEEIVKEPCVDAQEDCKHCDNWCEHKDILEIIHKAKGEEE